MASETSLYPEHARPSRPSSGWSGRDLVIGTSLIALLATLFMPWFSGSAVTSTGPSRAIGSADGPSAHGYVWFVFALVLISLVVLVGREALSRMPGNLPSAEQILMIATGLALLLTIFAAFIKPSPSVALFDSLAPLTVSVGFSYGGFLALVAALVAFLATIGAGGRLKTARLGRPSMRRRPSASSPG